MAEVFEFAYPNFGPREWLMWAAKYKTITVAKKCAVAMYLRLRDQSQL